MNKLTLSALMASFLLIAACGDSSDDTADADKSIIENATEMTADVAESTSEVVGEAVDATSEMANDVADSAIKMKDKMMEEDKPED